MRPEAVRTLRVLDPCLLGHVVPALPGLPVHEAAMSPPRRWRNVVSRGRYMPTAKSMGLFHPDEDQRDPHRDADDHQRQAISRPRCPGRRGHQAGLGAERLGRRSRRSAGWRRGRGVEQVEGEKRRGRHDDADDVAHLHLPRGAAEDVADLSPAASRPRRRKRRRHAATRGRGDALHSLDPTITIVRAATIVVARVRRRSGCSRADQADEVAGHRGEEKPVTSMTMAAKSAPAASSRSRSRGRS